jgi:hypothetical protein
MILFAYAVYDNRAEAFIPPFFMVNDSVAQRAFSDAASDSSHQFRKHPTDFTLFKIGEYDDSTGTLSPLAKHVNLGLASQFTQEY